MRTTEGLSLKDSVLPELDILYMTRVQGERFDDQDEYERLKSRYILNAEKMKAAKSDMIVLHPLPRVEEISVDIDKDERACYFKQVANGKIMRKALILKLLSEVKLEHPARNSNFTYTETNLCAHKRCISQVERGLEFATVSNGDGKCCAYCESAIKD